MGRPFLEASITGFKGDNMFQQWHDNFLEVVAAGAFGIFLGALTN